MQAERQRRLVNQIDDNMLHQEYVTAREAAVMTGFTIKALEVMRNRRTGPRYFRVGPRIRYAIADLREWLEQYPVDAVISRGGACRNGQSRRPKT